MPYFQATEIKQFFLTRLYKSKKNRSYDTKKCVIWPIFSKISKNAAYARLKPQSSPQQKHIKIMIFKD
jgi:hypothetical protein